MPRPSDPAIGRAESFVGNGAFQGASHRYKRGEAS